MHRRLEIAARSLLAALAVLLAAAFLPGCSMQFDWNDPKVWEEATDEFDVRARDLDAVSLATHNGSIRIDAQDDGDTVHVIARRRAGGDDLEEARLALADLEVLHHVEGRTLVVKSAFRNGRRDGRSQAQFEVTVPRRLAARLESHNGACTVAGLAGDLDVESHNGRLELDARSSRVTATTHNGSIDYRGPAEQLSLETHNGEVRAALTGRTVDGTIVSHNGAIHVDAGHDTRGTIEGETSNGGVSVRAPSAGLQVRDRWFRAEFVDPASGRLELRTANGAIEVR